VVLEPPIVITCPRPLDDSPSGGAGWRRTWQRVACRPCRMRFAADHRTGHGQAPGRARCSSRERAPADVPAEQSDPRPAEEPRRGNTHISIGTWPVEEAIVGSPLVVGNKVILLKDGPDTLSAHDHCDPHAKNHIHLETYIIEDDEVGKRFG